MVIETPFLEIAEIAEKIGISQKIVRRYIASGKLLSHKIGNKYQVPITAFKQYAKKMNSIKNIILPKK